MRCFYVDTENIKSYDFIEDWNITKDDMVVFFVSENSRSIKFKDLNKFINYKFQMVFEDVFIGEKNAMDFQMVAHLTHNIITNSNIKFHYIVSDDNGFYTAIKYLNNKYTDCEIFIIKPEIDKTILKKVNKLPGLNEINHYIRNSFGQETCTKVYPTYRQLFRDIQEQKANELLIEEEINTMYNNSDNLRSFRNALRHRFGNVYGNEKYLEYKNKYILNQDNNSNQNENDDFDILSIID